MGSHLERGRQLIDLRRYDMAVEALRAALVDDPNDAQTHALLGLAFQQLERWHEATEAAETAVGLAPDYAFAH